MRIHSLPLNIQSVKYNSLQNLGRNFYDKKYMKQQFLRICYDDKRFSIIVKYSPTTTIDIYKYIPFISFLLAYY